MKKCIYLLLLILLLFLLSCSNTTTTENSRIEKMNDYTYTVWSRDEYLLNDTVEKLMVLKEFKGKDITMIRQDYNTILLIVREVK